MSNKSKLTAEHDNEPYVVSFERADEQLRAQVGDRSYGLSMREVEKGLYLLIKDHQVFECRVERQSDQTDRFNVFLGNRTYAITVKDPRRLGSVNGNNQRVGDASAQIASPMSGKVVRILVKQGDHVSSGDGIVIVEAMKMQNELKSPGNGVVTEIRAVAGATVNAGEVLAIVEAVRKADAKD